MPVLQLHLLGDFQLDYQGQPVTAVDTPRLQSLLTYLVLHRSAPQPRDQVAFQFWPNSSEKRARANLRALLHRLRKNLPEADRFLVVTGQTLHWAPDIPVRLDVADFEAAAGAASSIPSLKEAVALYRGDLLPNCYDDWIMPIRERLRQTFLDILIELVSSLEQQHAYDSAVSFAQRLLQLDPLREASYRCLMRLHARSGNRSSALRVYEECAAALQRELDVPPSPATQTLHKQIRAGESSRGTQQQHSSRDMAVAAAPPTALQNLPAPHNLPPQFIPLVGRENELVDIANLLADPNCRLLTLVGPGGIGKTRLAIETAAGYLQHVADGVCFVSLAPLESPGSLVPAIAAALDFSFYEGDDPRQQLLDYLRQKEMLLVLDNFEHLLRPAPPVSAQDNGRNSSAGEETLVADMLNAAPRLKILATSRLRLNLQVEQLFPLAGLDYPAAAGEPAPRIGQNAAVRLFLHGANRVLPGFAPTNKDFVPIAAICRRMQGMPLGILLAAGWIDAFTPVEIASEISHSLDLLENHWPGMPARHRSMRAMIDHSWQLLAGPERTAFVQLAIFRAGFTRPAAEEVAGASLRILRKLLNRSLLQRLPSGRFEMHELLRQFAAEKLAQTPALYETVRRRHGLYYTGLLEKYRLDFTGPQQQTALAALEVEIEDARVAWNWAVGQARLENIAQAVDSLYHFYYMRSRFHEGRELLAETLIHLQGAENLAGQPQFDSLRVKIAGRLGAFCSQLGDYDTAKQHLQTGLDQTNLPSEQAFAHLILGRIATEQGQHNQADTHLQQSLAIYRTVGDLNGEVRALGELAVVPGSFGNFAKARQRAGEFLAASRRLGRPDQIARALIVLAWPTNCLGFYSESQRYWQESLELYRKIGHRAGIADSLGLLGWVYWCFGGSELKKALPYYDQALTICRDIGHRRHLIACLGDLCLIYGELGALEKAIQQGHEGLVLTEEIGHWDMAAYCLNGLAAAASALGDFRAARQYLARSLQLGRETKILDHLCSAIFFAARLLAQESEQPHFTAAAQQRQRTKALELLTVTLGEPGCWQAIKDRATSLQRELEAALPSDAVAAAVARSKDQDLWATVAEALIELETEQAVSSDITPP